MSSVFGLARNGLIALWSWWLAELAGMLPRRVKQVGRRERRQIVLLLNRDETVVLERTGERARMLGVVSAEVADQGRQLASLLRRIHHRRQPVTLCLSGERGLRKIVSLPLAARDDLEQLLRFEMDRLTPFRADEVYFSHRIVETDAASRRIAVELAVAPKSTVEHALQVAHAAGVLPSRLELGVARQHGREPLDLLPRERGPAASAGERRLVRALILVAALLAIVAVAIPLQRQRSELAALTDQVAATRIEAAESQKLREQLDQLTQTGYFLLAEKGRRPMTTEVLAELTRLVPDQAYLAQLMLQGDEVQLHGFAATASDLIGLLDQSPLFRAPQFRSPVTQDDRDGTERFHLSVELAGDG